MKYKFNGVHNPPSTHNKTEINFLTFKFYSLIIISLGDNCAYIKNFIYFYYHEITTYLPKESRVLKKIYFKCTTVTQI